VTLPELHLAGEAIAALVDGELSRVAEQRALDHTARCPECRLAIAMQRQAKAALVEAGIPTVPGGLLSRLNDVPMTTDLGAGGPGGSGRDGTLVAASGGELLWAPVDQRPVGTVRGSASGPRRPRGQRPAADRPRSHPMIGRARSTRLRRGLAGTLAGLAFGVVAATVPLTAISTASESGGGNVVNRNPQVVPAGVTGLLPGRKTPTRTGTQLGTGTPAQQVSTASHAGTQTAQVVTVARRMAAAR